MNPLLSALVALSGGFLGWVAREAVDWLKAKAAHRRELEARLHDHRLATAEAAIPNLLQSIAALVGMLRAWRGVLDGTIRPELMASTVATAQRRIEELTAESHRAVFLLQFHFGDEIGNELAESDREGVKVIELMSEFMTNADWMDALTDGVDVEARRLREPDADLVQMVDGHQQWQRDQIAKMLDLAEKRQQAVNNVADKMRRALQPK